jgi:hypothetical protein
VKQVWKYQIPFADKWTLKDIPCGSEILTVQQQQGLLCVWVLVPIHIDIPKRNYDIYCRGTGHNIDPMEVGRYINTIQVAPNLIFHFFCGAGQS